MNHRSNGKERIANVTLDVKRPSVSQNIGYSDAADGGTEPDYAGGTDDGQFDAGKTGTDRAVRLIVGKSAVFHLQSADLRDGFRFKCP